MTKLQLITALAPYPDSTPIVGYVDELDAYLLTTLIEPDARDNGNACLCFEKDESEYE